jgi:hypothetical protein
MGNGYKWSGGAFNDARIQSHTKHKKKIEFIIASLAIIILVRIIYKSIGPQNGVTPHEHVSLHIVLGETLLAFIHPFKPIGGITFPLEFEGCPVLLTF